MRPVNSIYGLTWRPKGVSAPVALSTLGTAHLEAIQEYVRERGHQYVLAGLLHEYRSDPKAVIDTLQTKTVDDILSNSPLFIAINNELGRRQEEQKQSARLGRIHTATDSGESWRYSTKHAPLFLINAQPDDYVLFSDSKRGFSRHDAYMVDEIYGVNRHVVYCTRVSNGRQYGLFSDTPVYAIRSSNLS